MIDRETVSKILDAAQIVDVVSDFVTLKRRGVNYIGLCPFHDEKTGSFTVSPSKGIFKCFGCGKGGSAVHFIMEHEQLDYVGALRYLAKKYNIDIVEKEETEEEKRTKSDRESMFALNSWTQKHFADTLHNTDDGRAIGLSYFRSRGFTDETIERFALGYSSEAQDSDSKAALAAGYKPEFIEKCGIGLVRDNGAWHDRFRGRVIFPIHTISGKIVGFGGRVLQKTDKTAKYVNSPESEIYHKSNELYGIYFAKQSIVKHDRCFLVEGYTDVISMYQAGVTNVVASSGTSLTLGQIKLIHRFTPNITVLYDGDAAGIKASIRGIDLLLEEGMNVKVVLLPDGEDPDSYARSHNASDFIDFIDSNQVDFIRFKINLLVKEVGDDPIKRAGLISDVIHSVALIPDNVIRTVYIHDTSTLLNVDEQIILSEVQKILRDKRSKELQRQSNGDFSHYNYANEPARVTTPSYRNDSPTTETPTHPPLQDDNLGQLSEPNTGRLRNMSPFDNNERTLLWYILKNGCTVICQEEKSDGQMAYVTVWNYINESLSDIEPKFHNPLYARFFDELKPFADKYDFDTGKFYVNHVDSQISRLAVDMLTEGEPVPVSKIHSKSEDFTGKTDNEAERKEYEIRNDIKKKESLIRHILKDMHEYKMAIIIERDKELDLEIKELQERGEMDEIMLLIKEKLRLSELKKALSGPSGGHVILGPHR